MKKAGRPVSPMLGAAAGCWQGWGQAGICGGGGGQRAMVAFSEQVEPGGMGATGGMGVSQRQ